MTWKTTHWASALAGVLLAVTGLMQPAFASIDDFDGSRASRESASSSDAKIMVAQLRPNVSDDRSTVRGSRRWLGPALGREDCIGFSPSTAGVALVNGSWKFVDGLHWILDFASNQSAAQQAGAIIQHYNFNQQCFVVRPNAQMTYWKSGGRVPSDDLANSDCIQVNVQATQSQFVGGAWKVVDTSNNGWLVDYRGNKPAADQAAAIVHAYRLNRMCFVNRNPGPAMMQYWLSQ